MDPSVTEHYNSDSFSVNTISHIPMFHGTHREYVASIIESGFNLSVGSDQYLGVGVYFFDNENFAIWWRLKSEASIIEPIQKLIDGESLTENQLLILLDEFLYKFGVINVTFENVKILDLDNFKHKELFDKIYEKCYEKSSKKEIFETAVYDIMFEEMGFKKIFDGIILTTNLYKLIDIPIMKDIVPQAIIPYRIYCIKNSDKINNPCECSINGEHIDNCLRFMALRKRAFKDV